jgi:hypothetical protein
MFLNNKINFIANKMAFLKKKKEVPKPPKIKKVSTYKGSAEVKFEKKEPTKAQGVGAKKMTPREVWRILPTKHKILTAIVVIIVIGTFAGFFAFLPLVKHVEEVSPVKEGPPSEKVTTPEEVTPAVKIEKFVFVPTREKEINGDLVNVYGYFEMSGTATLPVSDYLEIGIRMTPYRAPKYPDDDDPPITGYWAGVSIPLQNSTWKILEPSLQTTKRTSTNQPATGSWKAISETDLYLVKDWSGPWYYTAVATVGERPYLAWDIVSITIV